MASLIDDDDGEFLIGRLLVAMPGIEDPRFERTVLYLCAHDEEAAMGLAVNRPVEGLTVFELLDRLGVRSDIQAPSDLVLLGGPLERERGFVLHTDDFNSPDSTLAVADGVALTATRDALDAMASAMKRPRKSLLALGYAGWGPGQLERELADDLWHVVPTRYADVFDPEPGTLWRRVLRRQGGEVALLSSWTPTPELN